MADVKSVMAEALGMRWEINRLLRLSSYNQYGDLSELKINYEDAEQLFLLDELKFVMDKLADVHDRISYMARQSKRSAGYIKILRGVTKPETATITPADAGLKPL